MPDTLRTQFPYHCISMFSGCMLCYKMNAQFLLQMLGNDFLLPKNKPCLTSNTLSESSMNDFTIDSLPLSKQITGNFPVRHLKKSSLSTESVV